MNRSARCECRRESSRGEPAPQAARDLGSASPWWERKRAVEELSAAGVDPGLLFRLLPDERSLGVRLAIIQAAERATGAQIAEVTNRALGEIDYPDAGVAAAAIRALGVLRPEAARAEVIDVLDDWCAAAVVRPKSYHPFCIVKAAVGCLSSLGPPEVASRFVPLLAMRRPPVRACATWGIARLRYRPAAPARSRRWSGASCCLAEARPRPRRRGTISKSFADSGPRKRSPS